MSTISKALAEQLIANNGYYVDDTPATKIITYDNMYGGKSWAVVYPHEDQMRYEDSPACLNVTTIWTSKENT